MEPVDTRAEVLEDELRAQTDLEDWVWNDCDLQSGEVEDEDSGD